MNRRPPVGWLWDLRLVLGYLSLIFGSWQAVEAVRDHSKATGVTRAIGFVLATYAGPDGGNVFPGIALVRRGMGAVSRRNSKGKPELAGGTTAKSVVNARRWFVENGEAKITGYRPSRTGSPVPELSFAPLLRRSKGWLGEPLEPDGEGLPGQPFDGDGLPEPTLKGSPSQPRGFAEDPSKGFPSQPEPEGNQSSKSPKESPNAGAGARAAREDAEVVDAEIVYSDGPTDAAITTAQKELNAQADRSDWISGLSPSSTGFAGQTAAQVEAERREQEVELAECERLIDEGRAGSLTVAAAAQLREALGLEVDA